MVYRIDWWEHKQPPLTTLKLTWNNSYSHFIVNVGLFLIGKYSVKTNFDFIILGAGSAGCVLANRLSANPDVEVCLTEAKKQEEQAPNRPAPQH